jgi:hypothetical protein
MDALRFTQLAWGGRRGRAPSWREIQFSQGHHDLAGALAKRGDFANRVSFVAFA